MPPLLADPWPQPFLTGEAAAPATPHPPGTAAPYRPPRRIRRLVLLRAPRCEFPGCGEPAERCDVEHDTAWPDGPTCSCNLGPCCRRHHRVKQQGWTKQRGPQSAVVWTSPTGRAWTSRGQHQPPARPVRPLTALPGPRGGDGQSAADELSPIQLNEELYLLVAGTDDPPAVELGAPDVDPDHAPETTDDLARRLRGGETRWTLDLDDPYAWLDELPAR